MAPARARNGLVHLLDRHRLAARLVQHPPKLPDVEVAGPQANLAVRADDEVHAVTGLNPQELPDLLG